MRSFVAFLVSLVALAAVVLYASAFIVHQNQQALVLRLGNPQQVITGPGLNWKVPFVDSVEYFDKRILDLDTTEREMPVGDKQRLIVDAYARYKITDPLKFYQNVRSEERLQLVLGQKVESEIREVLTTATLQEIVKDKREILMKRIADEINKEGKSLGIEVVDVRIKRTDLPQDNLVKVFERMKQDRIREATELRAQGDAEKNRIQAKDRKSVV